MFWPKEIWGKYAKKLEDFKSPENSRQAVGCLNELVTDALRHAPHCLQYMAKLRNPDIFRFCAIPQVQSFAPQADCCERKGCRPMQFCQPSESNSPTLKMQL